MENDLEFVIAELREWENLKKPKWCNEENSFNIIIAFKGIEIALGNEVYPIDVQHLAFIGPRKCFSIVGNECGQGYILSFTSHFYENSLLDSDLLNSPLFFDGRDFIKVVAIPWNQAEFTFLFVNRIWGSFTMDEKLTSLTIHNCIEALLLEGKCAMRTFDSPQDNVNFSVHGIINMFSVLVHKHYRRRTDVKYYADRLNITTKKLSNICVLILHKTAKTLITDIVLKEAIRYIRYTDLSIAQIAFEMGFSDESNFRHFVKKRSGKTSMEHRNKFYKPQVFGINLLQLSDDVSEKSLKYLLVLFILCMFFKIEAQTASAGLTINLTSFLSIKLDSADIGGGVGEHLIGIPIEITSNDGFQLDCNSQSANFKYSIQEAGNSRNNSPYIELSILRFRKRGLCSILKGSGGKFLIYLAGYKNIATPLTISLTSL